MVACFAPEAVVRDEGHTYTGTDAIRAWKKETSAKYRVTAEPIESRTEGDSDDRRRPRVRHVQGQPGEPDLSLRLFRRRQDQRAGGWVTRDELAGEQEFESCPTVLETVMLPLHHTP